MVGFLAALPLIFQGIDLVGDLFDEGRKVYEQVAGKPSAAATPADLRAEVEALPPAEQERFVDAMRVRVEAYKAETARLTVQGGAVDAATLAVIPERQRARIALLRMTTRPLIARMMARVIMLPVYVLYVDGTLAVHNIVSRGYFGGLQLDYLAAIFFANDAYVTLYTWAAPTAASVIGTYMTLREVGKARGRGDGVSIGDLVGRVKGLVSKARG